MIVPRRPQDCRLFTLALALCAAVSGCGASVVPLADAGADRVTSDAIAIDRADPPPPPPPPPDAASECSLARIERALAPQVLFSGQPLALTVEAPGQGCGCALSLAPNALSSARGFDPTLCGCCRDCECADNGYRASVLLGAPAEGRVDLAITGESARRSVRVLASAAACTAEQVTVSSVVVRGPEELRATGPRLYWAEVRGTHRPCCSSGVGFVDAMSGNTFSLEPRSCEVIACAMGCPPLAMRPTAEFTTAHLLGDLRPGDYRVSVGGASVSFNVPR